MPKKRYFALVAHCLLNPSTRVHLLGRRFSVAEKITDYFLSKHISIIQLPCPEFTAMGYWRNPQGRQQYDNVFFRKHCRRELEKYVDMVCELKNNSNTPLCFIGIQGSPTCSIQWGKHKVNKYKTESMEEDLKAPKGKTIYGVMTEVLDEMLREHGIEMPYLEAPVKENLRSDRAKAFFEDLDELMGIPASGFHNPELANGEAIISEEVIIPEEVIGGNERSEGVEVTEQIEETRALEEE